MTYFLRTILMLALLAGACGAVSAAPVNINLADANTIAGNLKGIGLKKAEAIVAHRDANGPFKAADDLTVVKGIGQHTVDLNRADIRIDTPAEQ